MNLMSQENPVQKKSNLKVIALAVICVILAASLVGVIALYRPSANTTDLQTQITDRDNTISTLNATIQTLQAQANNNQAYVSQIAYLQQELDSANALTSGYFNIAIMNASDILLYQEPFSQDANATTAVFTNPIDYSGYVVVQATATANTTYAEVLYNYAGAFFDYTQTIGTSGSAAFAVLPGTIQINIGNTNQTTTNTMTVTAQYYY